MSKEWKISFTGICFFVPHNDEDKVSVYLPDTTRTPPNPVASRHREHEARIVHKDHNGTETHYSFDPQGGGVRIHGTGEPDADRESVRNATRLLHVNTALGRPQGRGYPMRRRRNTPGKPPDPLHPVLGWFELSTGRLTKEHYDEEWKWTIEPWVGDPSRDPGPQSYAWMITWTATDASVSDLELTEVRADGSPGRKTTLAELDPPEFEVRHTPTDGSHGPGGGHPHPGGHGHQASSDDRKSHVDFQWFYELLANKPGLPRGKDQLPVPVLVAKPMEGVDTHDCLPGFGDCDD